MSVTVTSDIVWARVDGVELGVDLYRPDVEGLVPVVAYFHGGAWKEGDKSADGESRLRAFAENGVALASFNYRLIDDATFPAQLHDVKGAVRWLRAQAANLGLDTLRIGIWGASAGATIGSLAALTAGQDDLEGDTGGNLEHSSAVGAVVHWFGPVDLVGGAHRTWLEKIILAPPLEPPLFGVADIAEAAGRARAASPIFAVSAEAPPFLVAHGDRDRVLPVTESQSLHDAITRAGGRSRLLILGGAGHEDHAFDAPDILGAMAAFFLAHLREKAESK